MSAAAGKQSLKVRNVLEGWEDKKPPVIAPHLPNPPFRWLVIAPTSSGKTNVITQYLTEFATVDPDGKSGKSIFDRIMIFSPSARSDPHFRYIVQHSATADVTELYEEFDLDLIHETVSAPPDGSDSQTLIYVDDFAFDRKSFEAPEMKELFFRGRHNRISCIVSSQSFFAIPANIRTQVSHYSIYRLGRESELIHMKRDLTNIDVNSEMIEYLIRDATKKRHEFLFIDCIGRRYFRNFDQEYSIDGDNVDSEPEATPKEEEEPDLGRKVIEKVRFEAMVKANQRS